MRRPSQLLHSRITDRILGSFFQVYNRLGPGLAEAAYERALVEEVRKRGGSVFSQRGRLVRYGRETFRVFRPDLLVDQKVIVEIKARSRILKSHWAQLLHYMQIGGIEVGLVLNFGPQPEFKRLILSESRTRRGGAAAEERRKELLPRMNDRGRG